MDFTHTYRYIHRYIDVDCLDGPASTMEKPCGALWGMVAKHRIPSRIQAQGSARSVRRDALEIAFSETAKYTILIRFTRMNCRKVGASADGLYTYI